MSLSETEAMLPEMVASLSVAKAGGEGEGSGDYDDLALTPTCFDDLPNEVQNQATEN